MSLDPNNNQETLETQPINDTSKESKNLTNGTDIATKETNGTVEKLPDFNQSTTELIETIEDNGEVDINAELKVYQDYLDQYQKYYTSLNLLNQQQPKKLEDNEKFNDHKDFLASLQDPTVPVQVALERFRKQILFEGIHSLEGILAKYLNSSPNCQELVLTWEVSQSTAEATDLDKELVNLFSIILTNMHSSPGHHLGVKLYKIILEKFSKTLQRYLTNNFPNLNKSVFELLISINKFGFTACKEVAKNLNLTTKEVMNHALPSKSSTSKPEYHKRLIALRKSYVEFCLSFFKFGDHETKLKVLELKDFIMQIFKGLEYDSVQLLKETFSIFLVEVGANPYFSRNVKLRFFNKYLLQQVTALLSKTQTYNLTDKTQTSPAQLAYEFLKEICSKPGIGICFHDFGWYHPSTFKEDFPKDDPRIVALNGALLDLTTNLKPVTQPYEQMLYLDILKACPELIAKSWSRKELGLEPRVSSYWLGSITWLQKVVNLPVPKWEGTGRTSIKTDMAPPMSNVVENILPNCFTNKIQVKGVTNDSALIKFTTLNALVTVLRKFSQVLDSIDRRIDQMKLKGRSVHDWENLKREVGIEVRKRLITPQPIMQCYFKLQSQKGKVQISESQQWLMNQTLLRILRYLYNLIPESLLVEKWQLHKNFPDNFHSITGSSQGLFMSLLDNYPSFIWWRHPNKKGNSFSPLTQLLYLQFTSTTRALKYQATGLVRKFLMESIIFSHNPNEALVWIEAAQSLYTLNHSISDAKNIFSILEFGLNQAMTYKYKYLEQLNTQFHSHDSEAQDNDLPFSPLLLALEFWYFDILPNLPNVDDYRLNYFKFITRVIIHLIGVTKYKDFLIIYFNEWKQKVEPTLSENATIIKHLIRGVEDYIKFRSSESQLSYQSIQWQSYSGHGLSNDSLTNSSKLGKLLNSSNWDTVDQTSFLTHFIQICSYVFTNNDRSIIQSLVNFISLRYPCSGPLFTLQNMKSWISTEDSQSVEALQKLIQVLPPSLILTITTADAFSYQPFLNAWDEIYKSFDFNDHRLGSIILNHFGTILTSEFSSISDNQIRNLLQVIDSCLNQFPMISALGILTHADILNLFFSQEWCSNSDSIADQLYAQTLVNSYLIHILNSDQFSQDGEISSNFAPILTPFKDKIKLAILNWLETPSEVNPDAVLLTIKGLKLVPTKDLMTITKHLLKRIDRINTYPIELHHTMVDLVTRTLDTELFCIQAKTDRRKDLAKLLQDYLSRWQSQNTPQEDFYILDIVKRLFGITHRNSLTISLLRQHQHLSNLKLPYSLMEILSLKVISSQHFNLHLLSILDILISNRKGYSIVNDQLIDNGSQFFNAIGSYTSFGEVVDFVTRWLEYYSINAKLANSDTLINWNTVGFKLIYAVLMKVHLLGVSSNTNFDSFFTLISNFGSNIEVSDCLTSQLDPTELKFESPIHPRILDCLLKIHPTDARFTSLIIDSIESYFNSIQTHSSNDLIECIKCSLRLVLTHIDFITSNDQSNKALNLINTIIPHTIQSIPSELPTIIQSLTKLISPEDHLTIKNHLEFIFNKLIPDADQPDWAITSKKPLIDCLRILFSHSFNYQSIWDEQLLTYIRALYSGTSSEEDMYLLKLMSHYELAVDITLQLDNMLWGHSVLKYPKWEVNAMVNAGTLVEISMSQLDPHKMFNLIKHFDPYQPLENFDYQVKYLHKGDIYDLRFILPLIGSWFYLRKQINITEFIQKNFLGVLIISTSSNIVEVRRVAYQLLDEFITIVQQAPSTLKEKAQILRIVECLAILVTKRDPQLPPPRLPSAVVQFVAHTLTVILKPDHPMFLRLSKFILSPYPLNYHHLPMMDTLIECLGTKDEYTKVVRWYLGWFASSVKVNSDFRLVENSNLLSILTSYASSSRCTPPLKRHILNTIYEWCQVPDILASYFMEGGLLTYLSTSISDGSIKLDDQCSPLIIVDLLGYYRIIYHIILSTSLNQLVKIETSWPATLLNQISFSFNRLKSVTITDNNFWHILNLLVSCTQLCDLLLNFCNQFKFNQSAIDLKLIKNQLNLIQFTVIELVKKIVDFKFSIQEVIPIDNVNRTQVKLDISMDLDRLDCWERVHYVYTDFENLIKFIDFKWSTFN